MRFQLFSLLYSIFKFSYSEIFPVNSKWPLAISVLNYSLLRNAFLVSFNVATLFVSCVSMIWLSTRPRVMYFQQANVHFVEAH